MPEQKAIDDWFASKEGQSCANIETLINQENKTDSQYLRNRLWKAFVAGQASGMRIQREAATEAIKRFADSIFR